SRIVIARVRSILQKTQMQFGVTQVELNAIFLGHGAERRAVVSRRLVTGEPLECTTQPVGAFGRTERLDTDCAVFQPGNAAPGGHTISQILLYHSSQDESDEPRRWP